MTRSGIAGHMAMNILVFHYIIARLFSIKFVPVYIPTETKGGIWNKPFKDTYLLTRKGLDKKQSW